jgi:hypothetical protein
MSRASLWRLGFAFACGAVWLQKVAWSNPGGGWDFNVYYYGAEAWRAGLNPYDTRTLPDDLRTAGFKFNYPPYSLALFAPLTWLTVQRAMAVFLVVKLAVFGYLMLLWSRLLRIDPTEPAWLLFLIFAYSSTIFIDFAAGSVTTFEQCLLWVGFAALLGGRRWLAVAAIVAASLLRITPILLLLVCVVVPDRRRLQAVAVGVAAFVAIFALTYAAAPQLTLGFFESIPKNFGERGRLNPALLPLILDLLDQATARFAWRFPPAFATGLYAVVAGGIVAATVVVLAAARGDDSRRAREASLYFALLAYAIALPRFKNYHYVLLIVPTYFIAVHAARVRRAVPLLLIACLPVYNWITSAANITLIANYSQWLIALGAWALYAFEIRGGLLLEPEAAA